MLDDGVDDFDPRRTRELVELGEALLDVVACAGARRLFADQNENGAAVFGCDLVEALRFRKLRLERGHELAEIDVELMRRDRADLAVRRGARRWGVVGVDDAARVAVGLKLDGR